MQYTLKDVLSIPLLKSAKLLSGEHKISSQPIESVSVIELPVENFVRKNDLVLTTAIGCGNNPTLLLSFIQEIIYSGAASLAIATGRHIQSIPIEVINFSKEHQFPIIELPWEIRFSDITNLILKQINKWEQDSLIQIDTIQRKLLQLYLENHPLDEAISYLAEKFHAEIHIYHHDEIPTLPPFTEIININKLDKNSEPSFFYTEKGFLVQQLPIQLFNQEIGILFLKFKESNTSPIPWLVLNQAVTTLNLWLQKAQTLLINKNKELEEFKQLLLKGDWESNEQLVEKGRKFDYTLELPYVSIIGYPENLKEYLIEQQKTLTNKFSIKHYQKKLEEIATKCASMLHKKIICSFQGDYFIIFLESSIENDSNSAHTFLDLVDEYQTRGNIPLLSWGIGENFSGIFTFHLSFKNARTALEIGRSHKGPGKRSTYANTGLYQILTTISNDSDATELMHSTIGAVAAYDKNKGLDLLHTLSAYIYHQGNVSQTARALSLHRQSLLYRLRKIETLTKRTLSDPDDLFLLQLCLKLWTVRFDQKVTIH